MEVVGAPKPEPRGLSDPCCGLWDLGENPGGRVNTKTNFYFNKANAQQCDAEAEGFACLRSTAGGGWGPPSSPAAVPWNRPGGATPQDAPHLQPLHFLVPWPEVGGPSAASTAEDQWWEGTCLGSWGAGAKPRPTLQRAGKGLGCPLGTPETPPQREEQRGSHWGSTSQRAPSHPIPN